jgi:uncharacterized protein YggT (Ycf19 family)
MSMIARLVEVVAWGYNAGLLAYVVTSWLRARWAGRARRALAPFYEPALRAIGSWLPPVRFGRGRLDLSPIALFVLVVVVRSAVVYILVGD